MKLEELIDEEMYVLVAPDGNPKLLSMAPDFTQCVAMCQLLAISGIGQPLKQMLDQGYEVLPVKVTIKGHGSEDEGFQRAKQKLKTK